MEILKGRIEKIQKLLMIVNIEEEIQVHLLRVYIDQTLIPPPTP